MKAHLIQLLQYDHYATNAILDTMIAVGTGTAEPARLMAHTLGAQQIWLLRCQLDPIPRGPLWPDWTAQEMKAISDKNHQDWMDYLADLQNSDLENIIPYQNTKGDSFNNTVKDILTQVLNHGTHHRGQIGIYLKQAGATLPVTDYIFFVRSLQ